MNECITRNIISNHFVGIDLLNNQFPFNKHDLMQKIDLWKYILIYKCNAKKGDSILIGMQKLNLNYFSICFASLELSLKLVIIDYNRKDNFENLDYFDSKTRILSPIDIFLHDFSKDRFKEYPKEFSKFIFFSKYANKTFSIIDDIDFIIDNLDNFNISSNIFPNSTDIAMRCTSSGTTGTPKIIEHTHEFLYKISKRNSKKFSGICLHTRNLNHGSSLAVYLLPALINDKVDTHLFWDIDETSTFDEFVNIISNYRDNLEYVIFSYPFMIDKFIDSCRRTNIFFPNLNIQSLSYIQDEFKVAVRDGIIKSITSIFGSNETSGPVFELKIDKNNLNVDSTYFNIIDDFYKIKIYDTGLIGITLPVYDIEIITNDIFTQVNDFYVHGGRSDIVKINGEILDLNVINILNSKFNSYIIVDTVKNCLYLAHWDKENKQAEIELNLYFKTNFNHIRIKKILILNKGKFLTGIKIDNELIREYFRNYISEEIKNDKL